MPGREDRAQLRLAEHKRPYTTRRFITARAPRTSLWTSSSRKTLQVSLFYRRWVFLYDTDHLRYQVAQVDNATRRFRAERANTFSSQKIGRLMGWEKARAIRLTTDNNNNKKETVSLFEACPEVDVINPSSHTATLVGSAEG